MSTLLEQAIIDAQVLRDAALKNAETTILEKYGNEVRLAVEGLLEQEDELGLDDMGPAMGMEPEAAEPPMAAAAGEELCPCPDNEEEVVMDFSLEDLKSIADDMEMGEPTPQSDLAAEFGAEDEEEEPLPLQEELEFEDETLEEGDIDEDIDIDENMIKDLVEELVVDVMPTKSGWLATPQADMQFAEELELARRSGTEAREEIEALQDAHDRLTITNESLVKKNQKLTNTLFALKEKLVETNLSNAKLLYMNQALNSASLNERQKSKVVESIRKADSVEEAKVIYETLQSAAGEPRSKSRKPKSLGEAIRRPSTTLPRRRTVNSDRAGLLKERFQKLAGINLTE